MKGVITVFMRLFFFLILCPFLLSNLFAQPTCGPVKVRKNQTRKADKLAAALTRNLAGDSEKVCAIYSWITSHIRYDVAKYAASDYNRNTVQYVLKKRRATCRGYTDLFNELCKLSGITSVSVEGYSKSLTWDQGDTFYYEPHVWNAVFLGKHWLLCDATWDAGSIRVMRKTLWGRVLQFITLGSRTRIRFKPRFIPSPSKNFYLRSGKFFRFDHMAAMPCWQLVSDPITPDSFTHDSCFYYLIFPTTDGPPVTDALEHQRQQYAALDEEDRLIMLGKQAYVFHQYNHVSVAASYLLLARKNIIKFDTDGDSASECKLATAAYLLADTSQHFYDTALMDLKKQRKQLFTREREKVRACIYTDKSMIRAARKTSLRLQNGQKKLLSAASLVGKRREDDTKYFLNSAERFKKPLSWHSKAMPVYRIRELDSLNRTITDSINQIQARVTADDRIWRLWLGFKDSLDVMAYYLAQSKYWLKNSIDIRTKTGWDNLDYLPVENSKILTGMLLKLENVILIQHEKMADSMQTLLKTAMQQWHTLHKLYRRSEQVQRLRAAGIPFSDSVSEQYEALQTALLYMDTAETNFANFWKNSVKNLSRNMREINRELHLGFSALAYYEIRLEKGISKGRKKNLRSYLNGIRHAVLINQKYSRSQKKKCLRHVAHFQHGKH